MSLQETFDLNDYLQKVQELPDFTLIRIETRSLCKKGEKNIKIVSDILALVDKESLHKKNGIYIQKLGIEDLMLREHYVEEVSYALLSQEAINAIIEFIANDTILDIGSGMGFWASMLKLSGIKIIPTDVDPDQYEKKLWCDIEKIGYKDAIKKYETNCMMLCWPYSFSYKASSMFEGNKLIYIGERNGYCTGSINHKKWKEVKIIKIPQWNGIHDVLIFYKKK